MIKTHEQLEKNKYGRQEFAQVNWSIDDVLQAAEGIGVTMTEDQALEFLTEYEDQLIDDMCNYAGDAMMYTIQHRSEQYE